MLGSSNFHEEEDTHLHHQLYRRPTSHGGALTSQANHMLKLLITCAELISQSDFGAARSVVSLLSSRSSPYGDSTDRLVHQFIKALSTVLDRHTFRNLLSSCSASSSSRPDTTTTNTGTLHSSYLSLNQITPFIRFSHLTANQAILEAMEGHKSIHILDLDTMQGVQWPPLMQAMAERGAPPAIRITGVGQDLDTLRRTGDRLLLFAQSLGLDFQFHPLHLHTDQIHLSLPSAVTILPDEALAVNCVLCLHKLLRSDSKDIRLLLGAIKRMNPRVVTVAEREASHNTPIFLQRFMEALDYYTAVFESLEATLPPNSRERLSVEQVWFGREIADIVGGEGEERRERHEKFETWVEIMGTSGFSNLALSPFALSQASFLLRLHYPSEGYQLQLLNDAFFLGWKNKALFSISSWH